MTLSELLDELRENVLHDDAELASGPDDRLWSDETLVRYLNDAQRRFARHSYVLRDASTPEVVEVTLGTGVTSYTLHKSIRSVASGRYELDATDLTRVGHVVMQETSPPESPFFDINDSTAMTPGKPLAISTDEGMDLPENSSVVLTVWPAPTATEDGKIIYLRVARMPLNDLSLDSTDASPEIPEEYHLELCEWAAYRCFRTADIDGASDKAGMHADRFKEAIDEAALDQRKKMYSPATYNVGAFGFSWG